MDESCKCQEQISLPEIDAVEMTAINISNTHPGQKSASGKFAGIGLINDRSYRDCPEPTCMFW
jgi:hypothetical protein